jgi:hypothetical protein
MHCTPRTILVSLSILFFVCTSPAIAAQGELTANEMRAHLEERDAAIIQLQHTVRDLMARLETVERSIDLDADDEGASRVIADLSPTDPAEEDSARTEAQSGGFAKLEVDEQTAQRALERSLIQGGALLLPTWSMEIAPSFNYALNQFDFPTTVLEDSEVFLGSNEIERTVITTNVNMRIGLPFDSQLELGLPYRWVDDEIKTSIQGAPFGQTVNRSGSGVGSLRVGVAKTFVRERGWRPDLVGRITWNTGSGDRADDGVFLGGFESIVGSLSVIKRYDPMVILGSVSYQTFFEEDDVKPGDQFAFSVGTALAVSPSNSLFALISNQFLAETEFDNQQIDGSNITSVTLNLGASTIVARGFLLSLTAGIGISEDAPDYSIGLSGSVRTNALRNFMFR